MSSLHMYNDSNRHYHNFSHVGDMLRDLEVFNGKIFFEDIVMKTAILYHDVYYKPGAWDNEYRSAIIARDECGLDDWATNEVERLILLTKDHVTHSEDTWGHIVIDLDLAGLATDKYKSNSEKIRKEFWSFSDEQWRAGRIQWLNKFLSREAIYYTEYGRENWEAKARQNMQAELDYLVGLQ